MEKYRIFASLSYFSVFFAGFIFPLAVYFIVDDEEVRFHAKRALISHIVPFISIVLFIMSILHFAVFYAIGYIFLFLILNVIIVVWNIIQGIKVML